MVPSIGHLSVFSDGMQLQNENAYIPSQDSSQDSTILLFHAIYTSYKSHDH